MALRASQLLRFTLLAGALALAACNRGEGEGNLAALDNQLTGNDADPALTSALQDQIAVDRNLSQQSNRNAARPADGPTQAQYPVSAAGGDAKGQTAQQAQLASLARGEGGGACGSNVHFDYNPAWANRLSPDFPLYPGARIVEAAGNNQGDCRVRVVTFRTGENYQRVLDWYHTRAVRAGYSSEHQLREGDHILAGAHGEGAFYLIVTPGRNGSEVALIVNNGR